MQYLQPDAQLIGKIIVTKYIIHKVYTLPVYKEHIQFTNSPVQIAT